jgi:hypothetical protein
MSASHRAVALAALGRVGPAEAAFFIKKGERSQDALGTTQVERVRLRKPQDRRLGPFGRALAVSLQGFPAHIQRFDQDPDGASAQEGEVARPRPGDDQGQELG